MNPRVLCLLADGFEEIEAITPIDLLRRAGAEVTLASIGELSVCGRCGVRVTADTLLASVIGDAFDLLLIPGGPGVDLLRKDGRAAELAAKFVSSSLPVAAICAAPLILKDAGLLAGRSFTAHTATRDELPEADISLAVIQDGLITTSRGAGTALAFGLQLVEILFGKEQRTSIANSILA